VNADAATHILESRIIQIIADGGLRPAEREHLESCGHCRAMLTELEGDLDILRQRAAQTAPVPGRHFVLPADLPERHAVRRWRWGWAALGTVLSAALIVLFLQVGEKNRLPGLPPTATPIAEWEDPELIEINRLAENALPEAYLALSESLDGGYDEGFIDFLIPPLDDNSVS
jgi:hypothetical protein